VPGVATGLAWTPVGGDILFIEATRIPGQGKLILTGQLGDVMKESAQAALSLNKSRVDRLDAAVKELEDNDVHIHVPAGAIPKDGPSAGVAMFVAVASLLSGRNVRKDVAMTGEISLRGLVLPVGGIKEKVLAALRAGIRAQPEGPRGRAGIRPRTDRVRLVGERGSGAGGGAGTGGVGRPVRGCVAGRPGRRVLSRRVPPPSPRWRRAAPRACRYRSAD